VVSPAWPGPGIPAGHAGWYGFIALNFTGSTTFTSRTGVKREMFAYIPTMAWTFGTGIPACILFIFVH